MMTADEQVGNSNYLRGNGPWHEADVTIFWFLPQIISELSAKVDKRSLNGEFSLVLTSSH